MFFFSLCYDDCNVSDGGSEFQSEDSTDKSPNLPGWLYSVRGK